MKKSTSNMGQGKRGHSVMSGRKRAVFAAACLAGLTTTSAFAQTSAVWTFLGNGSWNDGTNWAGGTPAGGGGGTADFSTLNITSDATVTLDTNQSVNAVIFGDAGLASNNWTLNPGTPGGALTLNSAATLTVNNETATINPLIIAAGGFTKTGGGTLVLNGNNTGVAGTATLAAGVTAIGNNGALGTATIAMTGGNLSAIGGARTINNAVELLGNTNVLVGSDLSLTGTINFSGGDRNFSVGNSFVTGQNVTLSGSINLSDDGATHTSTITGTGGNLTINGVISNGTGGAGTLNISQQVGTVTLNGANTYTGTTFFNAGQFGNGTLAIGNDSALGLGTFSFGATNPSGGGNLLVVGGDRTLANTILINPGQQAAIYGNFNLTLTGTVTSIGGARTLTNNIGNGKALTFANTLNLSADSTPQQMRLNGSGTTILTAVSGPGASSLQFSGSGTLLLRGSNTYGFLSVQSGTAILDVANGGALSASLSLGGLSSGTTQFSTPTFIVKGPAAGATVTPGGTVLGIGQTDSRIIVDSSAGATTLDLSGGTFGRGGSAGVLDVSTVGGSSTMKIGTTGLQNGLFPFVTVNGGADFATVNSTVLGAYTGYDTYSSGNLQNNTASNSLINSAGAASIGLGTGTTLLSTLTTKGAGSLMIAVGSGTILNLGAIGAILSTPGSGTLTIGTAANAGTLMPGGSTANAAGELLFINNSANSQIINSAIGLHGTGAVTLTKSGTGRTVLNGSGFYAGSVVVNGGTLTMGIASALGTGTTPTVNGGATLDLNGFSLTTNILTGNGIVTNSAAGLASLTIGNGNTNGATNITLTGNTRLVKTGTGSIQIANVGPSTNTGGAFIAGGTLRMGGGFLGTGSVQMSNATLQIAGSAPGPGYGSMSNPLVMVAGTSNIYKVEQSPWTQNGSLTGSGTLIVSMHPTALPPVFWNADDSAFNGVFRLDTASQNAGNTGAETGFNFTTPGGLAGSDLAKFAMTTDSQGFIAGWAGVGNATIKMGELSSTLGAGTAALRNTTDNTTATYQIGALNTNTTFGGSFIDGGDNNSALTAVTKVGNGTLTLTGAGSSFRGGLNVNSGVLQVNNNLTGSSVVTVNGGTLLANAQLGSGPLVVAGGNMFFNNVATAAHTSATVNSGTLHFTGNTTFGNATTGTGVTVNGGGTLDMVDAGINTLTVTSATNTSLKLGSTGNANLNFEITGAGGAGNADQITLANPAGAVQTSGPVKVNITAFGAWQGSVNSSTTADYDLIHAPGGISTTSFSVGSLPPAFYIAPPDFSDSTATDLVLTVKMAPIPGQAFWKGDLASGVSSFNGSSNVGNWTGGDTTNTNWDTGTNTGTDTHQLPGGSTDVIFSANSAANQTTTIGADLGIKGLELATSSVVTIGGANALSIGADGLTVDAGAAADTINTATVTLNGNQTWTNNSSNTTTIGAVISGPFALTLSRGAGGTGTFQLNAANTYTGGTTINTGAAVKLGNASALGSGVLTMNGGTLDLNNLGLTVGALAGSSGTILNGTAGNATLTFNVATGVSASSSATIVDGTGTVAVGKAGAGTVTLTGVNNYSGGTTVSGGTLGINSDAALGATNGSTNGTLAFSASGTLNPSGSFAMARPISVVGGATATLNIPAVTLDLNGPISGSGTLAAGISASPGTVTLSNTTSTFTGTLSVGSGSMVKLNNSGVLSTGTILVNSGGSLDLHGNTFSGVLATGSGGTFGSTTVANTMPALINSDTAHDAIISGSFAAGGINQPAGSFWQVRGNGNIQLNTFWQANSSNTATGGLLKLDNGILTLGGGPDATFGSNSNNQTVLQVGSFANDATHNNDGYVAGGTVILNKASTVAANTLRFTIINSGTLVFGSTGSITAGTTGQMNAFGINGQGVLDLNGATGINSTVGILSVGSFSNLPNTGTFSGLQDFGNGTILNNALTTATMTFGANNSNANAGSAGLVQTVFSANIRDGLGTLAMVHSGGTAAFGTQNSENSASFANGATSVIITNNPGNTFSGGLYLNGGTFYAASDDALGTGTLGLNNGAFAAFSTISHTFANPVGLGGSSALGDATRTGPLTFNGSVFINANSTLTVNSVATFSGAVTNGGTFINNGGTVTLGGVFNLTKAGPNTLTLAGVNTYTGNTSITAGTLAYTNSNGLNSTPLVNIASGGTLSVPGSFSTPATLTIAGTGGVVSGAYTHGAGTISPGSGNGNFTAGTVSFANGLTLNSGGATFVDLSGTATTGSDQIAVTGALAMNGGRVEVNFLTAPTGLPRTYTIATSGSQSGALGNLTVESRANIGTASTGTAVNVTVNSYTAGNLTWSGLTTGNGQWDLSTTANWTNAASGSDKFFQLDNVNFADAPGTVQTSVNLSTQAFPASVTVNNTNTAYTISGNGTLSGATGITKQGSGTFTVTAATNYTGTTSVQGGRLVLGSKAWGPALTIAGSAGADVKGGRLVYDYTGTTTPAATVAALLATGFGQATKFSTGLIHSSTATATGLGLGWVDNTAASQVSVVQTYYGDANLDGVVNLLDLNAVATNFGTTGKVWTSGNFNYDAAGAVDIADFNMLAMNFAATTSVPAAQPVLGALLQSSTPALGSVVPEPASLGLIGLGLATFASRRTRRNRNGNRN